MRCIAQGRGGLAANDDLDGFRGDVERQRQAALRLGEEYIAAAGIGKDSKQDRKGPLFRTVKGRTGELTANPLLQSDVWRMIRRRASQAGIETEIGCHTFRATGITAYLKNGGRLETAQQMAAHESARTTGLYDRRGDEISLDEVERIVI